jgi:two-component sensor histidine kinase
VFTALALVAQRGARLLDEAAASAGAEVIQSATIQARDRERSRFEALMHDGILATLLIASDDREDMRRDLASQACATLARLEALSADTVEDELLSPTDFVRIQQAVVTELDPSAHFSDDALGTRMIPGDVSAAVSEALTEALRNSLRHAGHDVARAVHATVTDETVEVAVIDDGGGFDVASVPQNRMGVAVSIVGRMIRLDGGEAEVTSHPARGTVVRLRWRRP